MELDRKQLNLNISSANHWTPIRLETSQNRTALSQQTYRLKAFVNGRFFEMDTKIGIRVVTIKRVEILVEGEAEVAIGCQPRARTKDDSPDDDSDLLKVDSTPLGYPFWVASLAFMAISSAATVVITKYCKP
ncbi:unnamed protein product [Rotaria socialis]|uniref:Uncharacterized protein n=1 Tax=Rotaria socialis TaxID=392032 RepID=A0A818GVW7_9BILA|nr:unnamed protein product [Rotaria socialis]CAF4848287.1 unnamed protein product [Rotaria socialis]